MNSPFSSSPSSFFSGGKKEEDLPYHGAPMIGQILRRGAGRIKAISAVAMFAQGERKEGRRAEGCNRGEKIPQFSL